MPNASEYRQFLASFDMAYGTLFLSVLAATYAARNLSFPVRFGFSPIRLRPAWIAAAALAVRLPQMFSSFWYDETWTGAIARMQLADVFRAVMADVHPPGAYLLYWSAGKIFGTSEIALRLPSLALGLGAVYLLWRLTWRLTYDRRAALIAALIAALLPEQIRYSSEARGYMLLTVCVLVAMIAMLENRRGWFVLAAGVLGWIHAHGFIYLAVMCVVVMVQKRGRYWRRSVIRACLISAAWLPFLILQSQDVANGFWLQSLTLPGSLWPIIDKTIGLNMPPAALLLAMIPTVSLTAAALWMNRRWLLSRRGLIWTAVAIGVPLVVALISWLWRPIYLNRALLPSSLLLVVVWSKVLAAPTRTAKIYNLIFWPGLVIALLYSLINPSRIDVRSAFNQCDGADYVYATSTAMAISAAYYSPVEWFVAPNSDDLNQSLSDGGRQAFGFRQADWRALSGEICTVFQRNPLSSGNQALELMNIQATRDVAVTMIEDDEFFQFGVMRWLNE